jgi:hypothetical protein
VIFPSTAPPGVPTFISGGGLVSGLAPIRASLDAFTGGRLATYTQAIAMTKVDGWK